jgi:hypothetical protein
MEDRKEQIRSDYRRRVEDIQKRHEQEKQNLVDEHKKTLAEGIAWVLELLLLLLLELLLLLLFLSIVISPND